MQTSRLRQVFAGLLVDGEAQVSAAEVTASSAGTHGGRLQGWAAVTDRALLLRFSLGVSVGRTLRVGYGDVKDLHVRPGARSIEVTYFDPARANAQSWYQHLRLDDVSSPEFAATLQRLVHGFQHPVDDQPEGAEHERLGSAS